MLDLLIMPPSSKSTATASSTTGAATSSATKLTGYHHHHHQNPHSHSPLLLCKHSPSATLDLLILILVLFSGTFLLSSYFSYLFHSLSLLLSPLLSTQSASFSLPFVSYLLGCTLFFVTTLISIEFCCGSRSRKCEKPGCKGLKKALEFDLQLQTEDCVKNGSKEIDRLPWKGGSEGNPDYECLRAELRKMAPPNGRAVLLFRARCGCPIAKLEGWGPKRGRRHKKGLASSAQNGDHR
ncbi:uncharacterized protein At5g19025 [Gossypium raimondii]|uniref:Ribosomal protein L34e superfamily protein n=3 Tax=Gossypium TaxID=3633 RepID=A0A0D2UU87_GOSRA|nr:uncharacterized protein At5g19025 [Gossypium raimondii]KJB72299.1 hypothetical protein B456_011G170000 [Gossypium raimondii]